MAALQRTIRRCAAPPSLSPMQFDARMNADGVPYSHPTLDRGDEVALPVFGTAGLSRLGSVGVQFRRAAVAEDA